MREDHTDHHRMFITMVTLALAIVVGTIASHSWIPAGAQEPKRYLYKIVDVQADNLSMQTTLNEYGAAGWELVMVGMGDMTAPRLIFKK
ncbi:MAG TPA: hypothetical protein VH681_13665 [Nitrospiraceae bacterium]